ncbi:MAG: hypothetical protein OZSIB_2266 [Candidatus Ozemobacter sibiricus]|uniref:VWFA domain-containing protein n=1 Tax=Candidatus Ozemobacter sibiricus TaxID=2268124 RepID=A0A367ZU68_9BACT|nr:MAG: hypothetical protein OZSIB_2266 [Candidatus Ozemobacter sibiricus]
MARAARCAGFVRAAILGLIAVALLMGATPAGGQEAGEQPTFRASVVDFPVIAVRVKLLASEALALSPEAFRVSEDGQPIDGFSLASATPRSFLTLLLDRSSSVESVMGDLKRSAARFLTSLPPETRISLMSFGSDTDIHCDHTTDRRTLIEGIKALRPWGGTALYDALHVACEQLYANSDPRDLRTIVLFTDGRDETPALRTQMSIKSLPEVLKLAVRHNIRLITVGMGEEIDRQVLQQMARETGGWASFVPTAKELYDIYQSISQKIRRERHFVIQYLSPRADRDGRPRRVTIEVALPDGSRLSGETTYEPPPSRPGTRPTPAAPAPTAARPPLDEGSTGGGPAPGLDIAPPPLPPPDARPAPPMIGASSATPTIPLYDDRETIRPEPEGDLASLPLVVPPPPPPPPARPAVPKIIE